MRKRKPVPNIGQTPRTPSKHKSRIQPTTIISGPTWVEVENVPCDGCMRQDSAAVAYCKACDQCLCARCNEYTHVNGIPSFKTHPLLPMSQRPPLEQRCPKHNRKPLKFFCLSCKDVCCNICADDHKGHDVVLLHKDAVPRMRDLVKESLETLSKTLSSGQIALESSQAAFSQLDADYHNARRAIQESSSALRNAINTREAELLKLADTKRAELSKKLDQNAAGLEPATAQAQFALSEAKKEVGSKDAGSGGVIPLLQNCVELIARMNSAGDALKKVLEVPSSQHPLPRFGHGGLMAYVPSRDGRQILASLRAFGTVSVDGDFKSGKRSAGESFDGADIFVPRESTLSPPPQTKRRVSGEFGVENGKEGEMTTDTDNSFILSPVIKSCSNNNNDNDDCDFINSLPLIQPQSHQSNQNQLNQNQINQPQINQINQKQSQLNQNQIPSMTTVNSSLYQTIYSSEYIQKAEERLIRFGGQIDTMVDKLKRWMSTRVFAPVAQGLDEMAAKCTSSPSSPAYPVEFAKTVQSWRPGLWLYLNVPGRSAADILYVAGRIRLFAKGMFAQESLAGRIADAQIIAHGFATFFDQLIRSGGGGGGGNEKGFSERFVVRAPASPEDGSRERVVIYQRCIDPPHFEVYWKGKCCEVPPGFKNVFYALFIFVYAVQTKLGGVLETVSLSSPAVDLFNVLTL